MSAPVGPSGASDECILCSTALVRLHEATVSGRLPSDWLCHRCQRDPYGQLAASALYEWHKGNALSTAPMFLDLADRVRLAAWGLRHAAEEGMRLEAAKGRPRTPGPTWRAFREASDVWLTARRLQAPPPPRAPAR